MAEVEPEPEPVVAEVEPEPEPVVAEVEPEPEPVVAEVEPEPSRWWPSSSRELEPTRSTPRRADEPEIPPETIGAGIEIEPVRRRCGSSPGTRTPPLS